MNISLDKDICWRCTEDWIKSRKVYALNPFETQKEMYEEEVDHFVNRWDSGCRVPCRCFQCYPWRCLVEGDHSSDKVLNDCPYILEHVIHAEC